MRNTHNEEEVRYGGKYTEEFENFSRHRQEEEGKLNEEYGYNTLDILDNIKV